MRAVLSFKTQSGIITVKDTSAKTMKRFAAAFLISGYGAMGKVTIAESLAVKIDAHKNFCESNSIPDFTRTKNDSFLFMNVVLSDLYSLFAWCGFCLL